MKSSATKRISLVTTVYNAADECAVLLESLRRQSRRPDEIIMVDGGSTDGTLEVIRAAQKIDDSIRLIVRPGANIAQGRNAGIDEAKGEVILSTDSGCRLDKHWVERMAEAFDEDGSLELAAGNYRIDPKSLLEAVVGAATMRGALDDIDEESFNPSCRSMGFTKPLWRRVGGFPEWIGVDDTLFNIKLRRMAVRRRFVKEAIVDWRPRSTLRAIFRQFRHYAGWRGHTQLDVAGVRYNVRNVAICLALVLGVMAWKPLWPVAVASLAYFYVYSFHAKARRIACALGSWRAYPLSLIVYWVVVFGGVYGYLVATLERWRDRQHYQASVDAYLAGT